MKQLLLLTLLLFISCASNEDHDNIHFVEIDFKKHESIEKKVIRDGPFSNLHPMLNKIDKSATLTVYKGLPHQMWEAEELKKELKKNIHQYRQKFPFYKKEITTKKDDVDYLRKTVKAYDAFKKWGGPKACGGYHPDYCLIWKTAEATVEMHICYGCHEVKVYHNGKSSYCDIPDYTYEALQKVLQQFR